MIKSINWIRLFYKVKDRGELPRVAIITLFVEDLDYRIIDLGNGIVEKVTSKIMYYIRINLWIVQLEFNWEKNV